ncbi:MAG: hypothetical protein MZW92_79525 [Comamonadaceae bacterium]|nr:hypothetical protein [Comamonadaceae bacterium]
METLAGPRRAGRAASSASTREALYLTSSFVFEQRGRRPRRASPAPRTAMVYARFTNPTVTMLRGAPGGAGRRRGLRRHGLAAWRRSWRLRMALLEERRPHRRLATASSAPP